jgi:uncharacterized protein
MADDTEEAPMPGGPAPTPSPETEPFWAAAREERLAIQRCNNCGRYYFYPRSFCRYCASTDVAWHDVSGRGTLVSYVINYRPLPPADPTPQVIALVELEEGPRMLTNIVIDDPTPEKLPLDARVTVEFEPRGSDAKVPVFRPVNAA